MNHPYTPRYCISPTQLIIVNTFTSHQQAFLNRIRKIYFSDLYFFTFNYISLTESETYRYTVYDELPPLPLKL